MSMDAQSVSHVVCNVLLLVAWIVSLCKVMGLDN